MTEDQFKRLERRLDRLEWRIYAAIIVAVGLAVVIVELFEAATP